MGLRWYRQVWSDETLGTKPASYKLVLLALAEFADDETGACWPSIATLARMAGLKERQTQNIVHDLAANGYLTISIARGRSNSNNYTLLEKGASQCTFTGKENMHSGAPLPKEKVHSSTEKGALQYQKGAVECTRSLIDPSVDPSINTSTKSAQKAQPKKAVDETQNLTKAILDAYVEARGKNGINYGKEGKAAKRIAQEGGTPERVKGCYTWLKQEKFWQHKVVGLATVHENLPEYEKYLEKIKPSPAKSNNGAPPEGWRIVKTNLYGLPEETK